MTDDIVTRLQMFSLDDGTDALNKLLTEAVDEIERLRAEVSRLGSFLHPIGTVINEQAVRGE